MENSNISWTNDTWNPWVGCDKVAPECQYCYIYREVRKQPDWETGKQPGCRTAPLRQPWGKLYLTKTWRDPYAWQKELQAGTYKSVFTCSLSDFFHAGADDRSVSPQTSAPSLALNMHRRSAVKCGSTLWRDCAWQVIKDTPNIVYQILTKRPENILSRLPKDWGEGWHNVWVGTSVGCNATLSKLDSLRKVPVHRDAVRFVSCEPLLEDIAGNIDLTGIGWVIAGGESGDNPLTVYDPNADWKAALKQADARGHRHMELWWARNLRRLCYRKSIPFWFKQISATRSGQGENALGGIVQQVPPAPRDGKWIDEGDE
jgi:protein gp37